MMTSPFARLMLALGVLLLPLSALAGNMSFRLSLIGPQLTVTNQGGSAVFFPAVFRMMPDGRWARLKASAARAELPVGAELRLTWPDTRPLEEVSELERIRPVMVRFFDQAGVAFGQISFFSEPPVAKTTLTAGYVGGVLQIASPDRASSIRASWVLWPQEDGIGPLRRPVRFEHHPPPALRIDWRRESKSPLRLDTGAGQPEAILIHETEQGYALQIVPGGGLQGREQRAAWLDAAPKFYSAALIALALALGAMVRQFVRRRGARPATGGATS